ncbi:MAG TPA: hypothetical protein PKE32_06190 [Miltoncostaeaceae bacterium]|nr:hypothetical protein [Miltoncostaeaceae bacterium]
MTEGEACRVLQVRPDAHPKVIAAAAMVLRELALDDPTPGAPRRLAEIDRARLVLRAAGRLS